MMIALLSNAKRGCETFLFEIVEIGCAPFLCNHYKGYLVRANRFLVVGWIEQNEAYSTILESYQLRQYKFINLMACMDVFTPTSKRRCLAVDSDGCVLDSMTEKHLKCFIPALLQTWDFGGAVSLARDLELEINLYSEHRGKNRFIALGLLFERLRSLLRRTSEDESLPDTAPLERWLQSAQVHSEQSLEDYLQSFPAPVLEETLQWTRRVNQRVSELPIASVFVEAARTLESVADAVDIIVVSSANTDALLREWEHVGLLRYVRVVAGQEKGTKDEVLRQALGCYGAGNVLMVGDAPSDRQAAQKAGVAFFSIEAGRENTSWVRLREQVLPTFIATAEV